MVMAFVVATGSPVAAQQIPPADEPLGAPVPPPAKRQAQPVPPGEAPAPAPTAADTPQEQTASPPADTSVEPVQSFDEPPAAKTVPQAAVRPPEDVQSFAEATMLSSGPVRFALNAFGDAQFRANMPDAGNDTETFTLGTLALLINARLGAHILGTAEAALDTNDSQQPVAKVERLHIRWQDDHYFVVAGRLHTDIGYWNTAYHHGPWLQLPIGRPRGVRGESSGGILPIHWVGVEGGLILPIAPGSLTVSAGVGNGRGNSETDIRVTRETNNFKAVQLKAEYLGLGWPDLRVGGSGLYDRIEGLPATPAMPGDPTRPALPDEDIKEAIGNAFVAYRGVNLTFIAEAFGIWHVTDAATFKTTDAYAVGGYRFGRITPYVQLERTDAVKGPDPFFSPVAGMTTLSSPRDQTELIVGTRVDTSVWSALKGEYSILRRDAEETIDHAVTLNWSFGI